MNKSSLSCYQKKNRMVLPVEPRSTTTMKPMHAKAHSNVISEERQPELSYLTGQPPAHIQ